MYVINGFRANVTERDLRWLCVLMKCMSEWPDKSRSVFESVEKCGGFLLMSKPKRCVSKKEEKGEIKDYCHLCRMCTEEDRVNLHKFLDRMYEIGQLKKKERGVPLSLVKFVSLHGCNLFKTHNTRERLRKPLV